MANLHKTERKLPWWVRDGGLCSDWLWGGGGLGEFFAVKNLCGIPDPHTHTHSQEDLIFWYGVTNCSIY